MDGWTVHKKTRVENAQAQEATDEESMAQIRLLPESGYRLFSTGYHLMWQVGHDVPRMWRATEMDGGVEETLDEPHMQASVSNTGFWISCRLGTPFLVGQLGRPLIVREFLAGIQAFVTHLPQSQVHRLAYYGVFASRRPYADTCFELILRVL